jgi:hypothetical protein
MTLTIFALLVLGSSQATPAQLPSAEAFATQSTEQRRAVMKQVDWVAARTPEEMFPIIERGLLDSDSTVRFLAASALSQVQSAASRRQQSREPAGSNARMQLPPTLLAAASLALDDEARGVRGNTLNALVYFWQDSTAKLTSRLLARYELEQDPVIRTLLMAHLYHVGKNDPRVARLAVAAMQDPAPEVQYQAALAISTLTPDDGLPAVVGVLPTGDPKIRSACVAALAAYGQRAASHISLLEMLRASEPNENVRKQIDAAIAKIRGGEQ